MSMASGVLRMGRKQAEALMESTCIVTRASTGTTIDPATGLEVPADPTTIYSGKCRLRFPFVRPEQALAAGQQLAKDRGILSLPVGAVGSADVKTDDLADVTIGVLDPGTVQHVRIMAPFTMTHATARRFPCEVIS